jgi:hypothetical protein
VYVVGHGKVEKVDHFDLHEVQAYLIGGRGRRASPGSMTKV